MIPFISASHALRQAAYIYARLRWFRVLPRVLHVRREYILSLRGIYRCKCLKHDNFNLVSLRCQRWNTFWSSLVCLHKRLVGASYLPFEILIISFMLMIGFGSN